MDANPVACLIVNPADLPDRVAEILGFNPKPEGRIVVTEKMPAGKYAAFRCLTAEFEISLAEHLEAAGEAT